MLNEGQTFLSCCRGIVVVLPLPCLVKMYCIQFQKLWFGPLRSSAGKGQEGDGHGKNVLEGLCVWSSPDEASFLGFLFFFP